MFQADRTEELLDRATKLVEEARKAGADRCDAVVARGRSTSVSVRLCKVEGTEASESDSFSLRVFIGNRVASMSANAGTEAAQLAQRAISMARVSPEDPFATLADSADLAQSVADLHLFDPTVVDATTLTETALAMEDSARAVQGVSNSGGAGASAGMGGLVLVTSDGFSGSYMGTRFGRSVSVIAGEGTAMEREYDFDSRLFYADLDPPEAIGRAAGDRTVRHLGPRQPKTGAGVSVIIRPARGARIRRPSRCCRQRRRRGPQNQFSARRDGRADHGTWHPHHRQSADCAWPGVASVRRGGRARNRA